MLLILNNYKIWLHLVLVRYIFYLSSSLLGHRGQVGFRNPHVWGMTKTNSLRTTDTKCYPTTLKVIHYINKHCNAMKMNNVLAEYKILHLGVLLYELRSLCSVHGFCVTNICYRCQLWHFEESMFCMLTGLLFTANEDPKMNIFYIPVSRQINMFCWSRFHNKVTTTVFIIYFNTIPLNLPNFVSSMFTLGKKRDATIKDCNRYLSYYKLFRVKRHPTTD